MTRGVSNQARRVFSGGIEDDCIQPALDSGAHFPFASGFGTVVGRGVSGRDQRPGFVHGGIQWFLYQGVDRTEVDQAAPTLNAWNQADSACSAMNWSAA